MDKLVSGYRNLADNESARNDINVKACAINTIGDWWPKAAIFYEIASAWSVAAINAAIEYINKYTPVTLIKRTNEPNYVSFVYSTGCSSMVGMVGGKQEIKIADWAKMGNVAHEIFHAAGLWHEHSRTDRDKYVTVDLGNLDDPKFSHNFDIHTYDSTNLSRYDYGSIMHYSGTAFAKANTKTIIPKDPSAVIGQRDGASKYDKLALTYMYLKK
jgi:hypothetical protein